MINSDVRARSCKNFEVIDKLYRMKILTESLRDDIYENEGAPRSQAERLEELNKGHRRRYGRIDSADKSDFTNLDRIFLEHNIQVNALYYRDCKLKSLAYRLNISEHTLEQFLQDMNARGDLKVMIDHRDNTVTFKKQIQRSEENRVGIQRFCQIIQYINTKYCDA